MPAYLIPPPVFSPIDRRHLALAGVYTLAPQVAFGVLGLEDFGSGLLVGIVEKWATIGKGGLVPEALGLLDFEAIAPGEGLLHVVGAIVFDVTLAADEGAHFNATGLLVVRIGGRLGPCAPELDGGR